MYSYNMEFKKKQNTTISKTVPLTIKQTITVEKKPQPKQNGLTC